MPLASPGAPVAVGWRLPEGTTFPLRFCFVPGSIPKCAGMAAPAGEHGARGAPAKAREFSYLCGKTAFLPLSNHIS